MKVHSCKLLTQKIVRQGIFDGIGGNQREWVFLSSRPSNFEEIFRRNNITSYSLRVIPSTSPLPPHPTFCSPRSPLTTHTFLRFSNRRHLCPGWHSWLVRHRLPLSPPANHRPPITPRPLTRKAERKMSFSCGIGSTRMWSGLTLTRIKLVEGAVLPPSTQPLLMVFATATNEFDDIEK